MLAVRIAFTSALVAAVGCTDALPSESSSEQAVVSDNKIAINKIAINKIAINKIAINKIAINAVAAGELAGTPLTLDEDAVGELVAAENGDGELVLEYLISCAFPEGVIFEGPGFAGPRTYEGNVGLAPSWARRQLTRTERGWLSACMISRVNLTEIPLLISLRGSHPGLVTTAEETASFHVEEGAFYGDIFTGEDPIQAFVCRGVQEGTSITLGDRKCAQQGDVPGQSECWDGDVGIQYVGDCAQACEERHGTNTDNPYYERCHDRATSNPKSGWAGSDRYDQVITVFLQ